MIEFFAIVTTLWCVWLSKQQRILAWPIAIVSSVAYFLVFKENKLYSDMTLQIVYVIQGFYGWYYWDNPKYEIPITRISNDRFVFNILTTFSIAILLGCTLNAYTDSKQPFLDTIAACFSLLANW